MDLAWMGAGLLLGLIVLFYMLGRFTPGTGADLVDYDPAGRAESRRVLEHEDTTHLISVMNRRRRAQGLPEMTEGDVLATLRSGEE